MKPDKLIVLFVTSIILLISGISDINSDEYSTFDSIALKSITLKWENYPIGDVVGAVALNLIGKPYVGGVLDAGDSEKCIVNLDKLDCVTLFEQSLDMARLIKLKKLTEESLINEVTLTRYRNGIITDYSSRLHYTADWIYDNVQKGIVKDITPELGGKKIKFNVSFMSKNPQYYEQLKCNPGMVKKIVSYEKDINTRDYFYIPKDKVAEAEELMQTGDIIAIVTSKVGLDYSHTGMIYKKNGKALFLHASSKKKKVVIDETISNYLRNIKSDLGITVLRPLEPAND